MQQTIKVSVIIPVYNTGEYLKQCLDSVLGQTLKEIEILCVDDGSTDGSGDVLEEYAQKDNRVKVYHQQNKFAGCARNLGLRHAAGKYLVFWDADDFFDLQALEKLYNKCEEDRADVCFCGGNRMANDTGQIYRTGIYVIRKWLPDVRPFSKADIPEYIFNIATNNPWNKMFLREFVMKHSLEFQPLRQANDAYFTMMAMFLAERITVVEDPLVTYRMDNKNSLTGAASNNRYCVTEALRAVSKKLKEYPEFDEKVQQSFANKALGVLLYSLRTQWDIQAYQELFDLYKTKLLSEFDISGHEESYIYGEQRQEELRLMLQSDYSQFLLYDFRNFEQRFRNTAGKLNERTREWKESKKELKRETKRREEIEDSTSYKIGRKITYLPGKCKTFFKKFRNN